MGNRMTADLVTDSLGMAINNRNTEAGLIVHSDRGSQYVSSVYQQQLTDNGFIFSMSRKENCWDNVVAESIFQPLKPELVHHEDFEIREEAEQAIFETIEIYYNRQRKHSNNGYLAPLKFEEELAKAA